MPIGAHRLPHSPRLAGGWPADTLCYHPRHGRDPGHSHRLDDLRHLAAGRSGQASRCHAGGGGIASGRQSAAQNRATRRQASPEMAEIPDDTTSESETKSDILAGREVIFSRRVYAAVFQRPADRFRYIAVCPKAARHNGKALSDREDRNMNMTGDESGVNTAALAHELIIAWWERDDDALRAARNVIASLSRSERDELAQYAASKEKECLASPPHHRGVRVIWEWVQREAKRV